VKSVGEGALRPPLHFAPTIPPNPVETLHNNFEHLTLDFATLQRLCRDFAGPETLHNDFGLLSKKLQCLGLRHCITYVTFGIFRHNFAP